MGAKKRQTMGKMIRERERAEKRARKQEKKDEKKAMREAEAAGIPYPRPETDADGNPYPASESDAEPAAEDADDPVTALEKSAGLGVPPTTPVS